MTAVVTHPRAVELVERRKLRRKVERAVSRLIAILDDLDGDPEAEPWLAAPETNPAWNTATYVPGRGWTVTPLPWAGGCNDDREQDAGDEPEIEDEHRDMADMEPSLGAAEGREDQRGWSVGGRSDLEEEVH